MLETGEVQAYNSVRTHNRDIFSIIYNMKVYCVFSLESPHRGDSDKCTQYTIFNIKRKPPSIILNLQVWNFSKGLKNKFETAVVNEPSVFQPLKFYCCYHLKPNVFIIFVKTSLFTLSVPDCQIM